jgi:hypothetical protein
MRKIKENFWILFVTLIIGNIVSDYFGLKGGMFSLGFALRFGIIMITYGIIQCLASKIIYVWNKSKNNNK